MAKRREFPQLRQTFLRRARVGQTRIYPDMLVGRRWDTETLLKSTLGIDTWLARDRETDQLAVVRVAELQPGVWLRLAHEAEVLGQLRDPRIPRFLHLDRDSRQITLVVEHLAGTTLRERLCIGVLDWKEAARQTILLLEVLEKAHQAGILHRDLKPSNLIWAERSGVIDWGLSRSLRLHQSLRDLPAGTLLYMAPEMSGALKGDVDERADLYSVGAVLYECLSGKPPFVSSSVNELLRKHLCEPPAPLPEAIPAALADFVQRLLEKEPSERYADAREARLDLERVLQGQTLSRNTSTKQRRLPLVGRRRERALLRDSQLLVLVGEAGTGKSTLLQECCREARRAGSWVIECQALSSAEKTPLQLLAGLFHEVSRTAPRLVAEHLPEYGEILARVAPELQPHQTDSSDLNAGPEDLGPTRVMLALNRLIETLPLMHPSVLIAFEDVHYADGLSLTFLEQLLRAGVPPTVKLILCARPSLALAIKPEWLLELGPLDREQSQELLSHLAAELPAQQREDLLLYAEGNPLLLIEGACGLAEVGDLKLEIKGVDLLAGRLRRLPTPVKEALQAAAILGKSFQLSTVVEMVGTQARQLLEQGRRSRVLWNRPSGLDYQFSHDRLREHLLQELLPEQRATLHEKAANALEGEGAPAEAVCAHLAACGQYSRAYPYALEAAERARGRYEFAQAAAYYRIALVTRPEQKELQFQLGNVLYWSGELNDAQEAYEAYLKADVEPLMRARTLHQLGMIAYDLGRYSQGVQYGQQALAEFALSARRDGRGYPEEVVRTATHAGQMALHAGMRGTVVRLLPLILATTLRVPKSQNGLFGSASLTSLLGHFPLFNPLARWLVAGQLGAVRSLAYDPLFVGKTVMRLSLAHLFTRPTPTYLPLMDEGYRLLLQTGELGEAFLAAWAASIGRIPAGQFGILKGQGEHLRRSALATDHRWGQLIGIFLCAAAEGGHVSESFYRELTNIPPQDGMQELTRRQALWLCLMARGRSLEAARMLEQKLFAGVPFSNACVVNMKATAWRKASEEASNPWERHQYLRAACNLAGKLKRSPFPVTRTHAYRELALQAVALGDSRRAHRWFRRSREVAVRCEYHYEAALTGYEWELFRQKLGLPADPSPYLQRLTELGAHWHQPRKSRVQTVPVALADRFDQLLEWGRSLTAASNPSAIHQQLVSATEALLRSSRVLLVSWPGLERLSGAPQPFSRGLLKRAADSGGPVLAEPDLDESVVLASSRVALAAPVSVEGRVEACLYVSHELLGGEALGDDEVRLARCLTELAGAALENCASVATFRRFFQEAGVAMALIDSGGVIEQTNRACQRLLQHSQLEGKRFDELLAFEQDLGEGEVRLLTGTGQLVWVYLTKTRLGGSQLISLANLTHQRVEDLVRLHEDERRLLSAELHDALAPWTVALNLLWQGERSDAQTMVKSRELLDRLRDETENLSVRLRGGERGSGALERLRAHLDWFRKTTRLKLEVCLPQTLPVAPVVQNFSTRMIQECLNNVQRHAAASQVEVSLAWRDGEIHGRVRDDGRGFEPNLACERRSGLAGLRFRAEALGGRIEFRSRPGEGCEVEFVLPAPALPEGDRRQPR